MLINVKRPSTLWSVSFLDMGPGLCKSGEKEYSSSLHVLILSLLFTVDVTSCFKFLLS